MKDTFSILVSLLYTTGSILKKILDHTEFIVSHETIHALLKCFIS